MNLRSPTQTKTTPSFTPVQTGLLQRKCASCGQHTIAGAECAKCKKEENSLQRHAAKQAEITEVPPIVEEVLHSSSQPLDSSSRHLMESRFGHDFSRVRLHTNTKAAESAKTVDALAYTVGEDVVFGAGQYAPETIHGRKLLAHELTHVVQQQHATPASMRPLLSHHGDAYEQAAQSNEIAMEGSSHDVPLIQRQQRPQEHLGPAATGAPADWSARVTSAKTSEQRAALVQEATGIEVTDVTDKTQGDTVIAPSHLVPYSFAKPHINYDDNLQQKKSSDDKRKLSNNAGLTVRSGNNYYIILSPLALQTDNFFETRLTLNHEFDHVRQYASGSTLTGQNSELDAWTSTFIREFHRAYSVLVRGTNCYPELTAKFEPLFQKYYPESTVTDAQREDTVRRITAYYNSTLRSHPVHSRVFRYWIHRILKDYSGDATQLAQRLNTDLNLGVDPTSSITETRRIDCDTVRGATFTGPPQVERPSATSTPSGGSHRFGLELRGGGSLLEGQRSAAIGLGARFSLRSDRVIIWNPLIGAHLLYLPATGDRTTHLAAAIGEVGLRVQQPVRGVYLDVRGGGYVGLELPTPGTKVEGGFTGAVGLGYRWERVELGAEARGMLGINSPDRVMIMGVGSISF